MLNIVVPMAGAGSRFAKAGYTDPKPLIPVMDIPMIKLVINNLRPSQPHRFIFICQQAHIEAYGLTEKLSAWAPGCEIIGLDGLTEGAACTVLKAKSLIDSTDPLMIANSDQWVDIDINDYLADMERRHLDGIIMTMTADDPKWSFAGLDSEKLVTRVVEKEVISDEATVGIYNYRHGKDFVRAAEQMIARGLRVNNEFYVAPAYDQLIEEGARIGVYNIGAEADGMYGLGIPADLDLFKSLPVCPKAVAACAAGGGSPRLSRSAAGAQNCCEGLPAEGKGTQREAAIAAERLQGASSTAAPCGRAASPSVVRGPLQRARSSPPRAPLDPAASPAA